MHEVKRIDAFQPLFPLEAYRHLVSSLNLSEGGVVTSKMPDFPGMPADGETDVEAMA